MPLSNSSKEYSRKGKCLWLEVGSDSGFHLTQPVSCATGVRFRDLQTHITQETTDSQSTVSCIVSLDVWAGGALGRILRCFLYCGGLQVTFRTWRSKTLKTPRTMMILHDGGLYKEERLPLSLGFFLSSSSSGTFTSAQRFSHSFPQRSVVL